MAALTVLASCSRGTDTKVAAPPITVAATGTSESSTSSSSTTAAPVTTATSRATTTSVALSPEGYAKAFYQAWAAGDRAAAARVALPEAVDAVFARPWQAGDGWSFSECSGAAGSLICTWQRPAGQQLLVRVRNQTGGLPVTVAEVRFQP